MILRSNENICSFFEGKRRVEEAGENPEKRI